MGSRKATAVHLSSRERTLLNKYVAQTTRARRASYLARNGLSLLEFQQWNHQLWWRMCGSKNLYRTVGEAGRVMSQVVEAGCDKKDGAGDLHTYECPYDYPVTPHYHFGHDREESSNV